MSPHFIPKIPCALNGLGAAISPRQEGVESIFATIPFLTEERAVAQVGVDQILLFCDSGREMGGDPTKQIRDFARMLKG